MARVEEGLFGGLWTAPDPARLRPGQLSALQNGVYLPGSQALQRATGRSAFGTASAAAVDVAGIRDLQLDNGNHYLVALASTNLVTAAVGDTGTFGMLTTIAATASQLEVAHYRNRFYLFNGVAADTSVINSNVVVYATATAVAAPLTTRQHGMLPVISAPTASATAVTFSQTVTGYYEYWTTEVAKLTQDGADLVMESAFSSDGGPTTVYVSSTGMSPVLSMPPVRNSITTHWRIYRSPKKDKATDKKFPTGYMIAEQATASANVLDGNVTASASSLPANVNTSGFFFGFATASALQVSGAGFASATVGPLPLSIQQGTYGYDFGGFSGSVKGIVVDVAAYATAASMLPVPITVTLGLRASDGNFAVFRDTSQLGNPPTPRIASKSGNIISSNSGALTTLTLGSSTDRWFASNIPGLVDTDFTASRLMAVISVSKPNAVIGVDYVKVYAYYSGTVDSTVVYPSVVYTFGDIVSQVSKNHPPPNASTGDLYEDSLVVNDVSNPSIIRYSFPGEPEAFPPSYFLDFETRDNDTVTLVKVVNSKLVVGLGNSIWRVNYLPSERDSSFDRGKAVAPISRTYGVVNPMCACVFSMDSETELLAFVSDSGIHVTDGYSFKTLTEGLNWRNVIAVSGSTSVPIDLINDRERQELVFHYRNDDNGAESYLALHLSYAQEHRASGLLKVSGPVHMRNFLSSQRGNLKSAWPVQRDTGATNVYLGYGGATAAGAGQVYRETGSDLPAQDPRLAFITRRMYQAGFANEWRLNELYGYAGSYDGAPTISYTVLNTKTDDTGETTLSSKSKTLAGQKLHHVQFALGLEGARVSAVATASAFALESLTLEGDNFGDQDSGR